jgi:hypothetical protein
MSTEDINKVVVTLNKGVDVDAFIDEVISAGNNSPYVPNRAVELYNEKPESLRNVDFVMTREEADTLSQDPRVRAVRYGTKKENGIESTLFTLGPNQAYTKRAGGVWQPGNVDMSWGMVATNFRTNQFTSSEIVYYQLPYTLTGYGVDFVIQDTGLQVNHPEFVGPDGQSRVQLVDWYALTGFSGTMPVNFYTDNEGHGTHVCSSATGINYGWAREAAIYVMNILGVNANSTIPINVSFNMLRVWHENKAITSTGYKRPTVVNMSWGYIVPLNYTTGGVYRGVPFSSASSSVGVVNNGFGRIPYVVDSVEADVEDCLDAGVILIGAAGNNSYKIDVPGGIDYDNTINFNVGGTIINNKPYMRGPSPSVDPRIIRVGAVGINIGDTTNPVEQKADYSNTGPGIAVYAPGTNIVGAISNVFNPYEGMHIYPYNSNFLCDKRSGTSMSAPQVSGIVCNLLQSRPWYDIGRIKKYLMDNATPNRLTQTGASGYSNFTDLQGGPNTYLYNPFQYTKPTVTTDLNAEIYGKL